MRLCRYLFASLLTAGIPIHGSNAEPPKIVTISPGFWAVGVGPGNKAISVTFDQPMIPGFTAWLGRSSVPPEIDLNTKVTPDRLTFSIDVKLQPGRVYVMGLNEKNIPGVGFQNDSGVSAAPSFLVFQTTGTPKQEDAPPIVVRTTPPSGAEQLDPARTTGIGIFFDRPMRIEKHGLHLFENNAPVDVSKVRFAYSADGRGFTLPYTFKPSTAYRVELNNVHDIGFASKQRIPLWPIQIAFTTGQAR